MKVCFIAREEMIMDLGLQRKHVLVTGGARGLGLAIAEAFLHEDAYVTILDSHKGNLASALDRLLRIRSNTRSIWANVSDKIQVANAIQEAEDFKPIDVLVNNAGVASDHLFLDLESDEWQRIINVNLTGAFLVAQTVARKMVARGKGGCILNMSSKNGLFAELGYAHYNASKFGIVGLTKTMALELAKYGIRTNAVCPGYLVTPMSEEIDPPGFAQAIAERHIPLGRPGAVDDVPGMFLFLASDRWAGFVNGQTFVIDGGQLAGQTPNSTDLQRKPKLASFFQ